MSHALEKRIIFDTDISKAWEEAQEHAGEKGHIESMPQLIFRRLISQSDDEIWNKWHTALTEEITGRTPQGNPVVIELHGASIGMPNKKNRKSYYHKLIQQHATELTDTEIKSLLNGKLPDGTEIPVYSYNAFYEKSTRDLVIELSNPYAVVLDLNIAKVSKSGPQDINRLKEDPSFIARTGGFLQADIYLRMTELLHDTKKFGNWHTFKDIDPDKPQGRLLYLGDFDHFGIGGCDDLIDGKGRFIAIKPRKTINAYFVSNQK